MGCSAHPGVTLSDIIHAAPRFLEMLDAESLKAVSATCSFVHSWVFKGVTALTLPNYHHLRLLQPQRWPSLYVVCISRYDDTYFEKYLRQCFLRLNMIDERFSRLPQLADLRPLPCSCFQADLTDAGSPYQAAVWSCTRAPKAQYIHGLVLSQAAGLGDFPKVNHQKPDVDKLAYQARIFCPCT